MYFCISVVVVVVDVVSLCFWYVCTNEGQQASLAAVDSYQQSFVPPQVVLFLSLFTSVVGASHTILILILILILKF